MALQDRVIQVDRSRLFVRVAVPLGQTGSSNARKILDSVELIDG